MNLALHSSHNVIHKASPKDVKKKAEVTTDSVFGQGGTFIKNWFFTLISEITHLLCSDPSWSHLLTTRKKRGKNTSQLLVQNTETKQPRIIRNQN